MSIEAKIKPIKGLSEKFREAKVVIFFKKLFALSGKKAFYLLCKKLEPWLFMPLFEFLERKTGLVITFHTRPLYSKDLNDTADLLIETPKCAVVLQGPVLKKNDFTLETIRIYKKIFRGVTIILSTWEDENPAYLKRIVDEGVELVLNKKPVYGGPLNINYQIISSKNGVLKASALGCDYALKIRTDMRMYNKSILESLCNLLKYFPPSERSHQNKRLIFLHHVSKYHPYAFSDMFVFGGIADMLEYWDAPMIGKDDTYTFFIPEMHLATSFLRRKGWTLDWTVDSAWNVYQECLITVDWSMVDLCWYKWNHYREYRDMRDYNEHVPSRDFLHFLDWFDVFSNRKNKLPTSRQGIYVRGFSK